MIGEKINFDVISTLPIDKINIINRDDIEFVQFTIYDNRIDMLLFQHYGYRYSDNYGISPEVFIYIVLCFNDVNDINDLKGSIKLPHIGQLLNNIIMLDDKVNGVYEDLNDIVVPTLYSTSSELINELRLKLSKVKYDNNTGIIKF